MVSIREITRAQKDIMPEVLHIRDDEMPSAEIVFHGIDDQYLFFRIAAKQSQITDTQKEDIFAKSRFVPLTVKDAGVYTAECRIDLMLDGKNHEYHGDLTEGWAC